MREGCVYPYPDLAVTREFYHECQDMSCELSLRQENTRPHLAPRIMSGQEGKLRFSRGDLAAGRDDQNAILGAQHGVVDEVAKS